MVFDPGSSVLGASWQEGSVAPYIFSFCGVRFFNSFSLYFSLLKILLSEAVLKHCVFFCTAPPARQKYSAT